MNLSYTTMDITQLRDLCNDKGMDTTDMIKKREFLVALNQAKSAPEAVVAARRIASTTIMPANVSRGGGAPGYANKVMPKTTTPRGGGGPNKKKSQQQQLPGNNTIRRRRTAPAKSTIASKIPNGLDMSDSISESQTRRRKSSSETRASAEAPPPLKSYDNDSNNKKNGAKARSKAITPPKNGSNKKAPAPKPAAPAVSDTASASSSAPLTTTNSSTFSGASSVDASFKRDKSNPQPQQQSKPAQQQKKTSAQQQQQAKPPQKKKPTAAGAPQNRQAQEKRPSASGADAKEGIGPAAQRQQQQKTTAAPKKPNPTAQQKVAAPSQPSNNNNNTKKTTGQAEKAAPPPTTTSKEKENKGGKTNASAVPAATTKKPAIPTKTNNKNNTVPLSEQQLQQQQSIPPPEITPNPPVPDNRRRASAPSSTRPAPTATAATSPKRVSIDSSLPSNDAGQAKPRPRPSSAGTMGDGEMNDSSWMADDSWMGDNEEGRPSWASRNSTNYVATDIEKAYQQAPKHKWRLDKYIHDGTLGFNTMGERKEYKGKSIKKGIDKFKANPHKFVGISYQTTAQSFDKKYQKYMLIKRKGTDLLTAQGKTGDRKRDVFTLLIHSFEQLPPFPNNVLPQTDEYTRKMTLGGKLLPPPLLPGRGMGIGDNPGLKIIGDIDPSDINQGHVGDCWLLSAISAIAEFDGAIKKLFRKTGDLLDRMPLDDGRVNFYTISLFDIETWEEVDYVIDESLCQSPFYAGQLLGSKPSEDGELWVPYLEKAMAIHCGGWDEIIGGQCTHAWAIMTGCKEQYILMRSRKTNMWLCMGKYNNVTGYCEKHFNSPHRGNWKGLWQVPWPKVGGGGIATLELTDDQLYDKMVAWDQHNFIVGAGTKSQQGAAEKKSDKAAGMVDDHAYSVIDCHPQVAGTNIDLLKIRNPWGQGEMEDGDFDDDGPGWDEYPEIKAELNPVVADDGLFYMTKQEFFELFDHIYISASNMTIFKED